MKNKLCMCVYFRNKNKWQVFQRSKGLYYFRLMSLFSVWMISLLIKSYTICFHENIWMYSIIVSSISFMTDLIQSGLLLIVTVLVTDYPRFGTLYLLLHTLGHLTSHKVDISIPVSQTGSLSSRSERC